MALREVLICMLVFQGACEQALCPGDECQDSSSSLLQLPRRSSAQVMRGDDVGTRAAAGPIGLAAKKCELNSTGCPPGVCPPVLDSDAFERLGDFAPPTCETLPGSVKYDENFDSINGIFYMLGKRQMLQTLNRPVVTKWNRSALSWNDKRWDRIAIKYGIRPYFGTYMHENEKLMGAVGQQFTNCTPGGRPTKKAVSPHVVAANLLHVPQGEPRVCSEQLNQWFTVWIQLNTEDWVHGKDFGADGRRGPSLVTMWWDMSSTYGSTYGDVVSIRRGVDGKVFPKKLAPVVERGFWVGKDTIKMLFAREHNLVAEKLRKAYPRLFGPPKRRCVYVCDEKLFGMARLIVSATIARIHTLDWTSLLLNTVTGRVSQSVLWHGLLKTLQMMPDINATAILEKLAEAGGGNPDNNTLYGIVGGEQQTTYDFAWTEEFSLVYRMHVLLPDYMRIRGRNYGLSELVTGASNFGYKAVARSLSSTSTCLLTLQNYPSALSDLITEEGEAIDLAAVDIAASRKRGAGSFNDFRRALHLDAAASFEDLVTGGKEPTDRDRRLIAALENTYDSVEDVDALVGLLAEPRLVNSVLGLSSYLIFALQTQTRLESDPFYTKWFDEQHYTELGLQWVRERTLAMMLKDHFGIESPHGLTGEAAFLL